MDKIGALIIGFLGFICGNVVGQICEGQDTLREKDKAFQELVQNHNCKVLQVKGQDKKADLCMMPDGTVLQRGNLP